MNKALFVARNIGGRDWWIEGKTYERVDGFVTDESGSKWTEVEVKHSHACSCLVEVEQFEAHGHTWFRHTPGEPMPCDGGNLVQCIRKDGVVIGFDYDRTAAETNWGRTNGGLNIIGWRFAVSAKPEQADRPITSIIKRVCAEYSEDESERNDLIAAVDDGHLTPGQKAYIQAKEDAQAAKQQLAKDAHDKALQERAGQLADAGKAMDRVNQDHNHRMGWRS